MSSFLFELPEVLAIPVRGETLGYPVRRIFCVGRNYAAHAAEMGFEVDREAPFYFTKSASSAVLSGIAIAYPPGTMNFHYEMELALAIGSPAFQVDRLGAREAIYGYCCALDMTRRDLQQAAREKQRPWDLGKDVEQSAVFSGITRAAELGDLDSRQIQLRVNGEIRQDATLGDLIWKVDEIVSHLSGYYHLDAGDLIMTGTPAGVGPVLAGDRIIGTIEGLAAIELEIKAQP